MDAKPPAIAAYKLMPDEFFRDVARVLSTIGKIDGKPISAEVLPTAAPDGFQIVLKADRPIGLVWAERHEPTWSMSADFVYTVIPVRDRLKIKYTYIVTTGRVTMGALYVAKQSNIHIIDGDRYERMRAKVYGWKKPITEPIYADRSDVKIAPRREATPTEMKAIYNQVEQVRPKAAPPKPAAPTITHVKHTNPPLSPAPLEAAHDNPLDEYEAPLRAGAVVKVKRKSVDMGKDRVGELTPMEQEVILAWRRGDKAEAAKIILNW